MSTVAGEWINNNFGTTILVDEILDDQRGYAKGPERALMSALLFDGIQSYMNYACASTIRSRGKYKEAFNWVHNKANTDYIFSFNNVCEALGIDAEYLRLGMANACNSQTFEWKRSRRNF